MMLKLAFNRLTKLFMVLGIILSLQALAYSQTNPTFTSSPVAAGVYGNVFSYSITTSDAEFNDREIKITSGNLPSGLNFTDNGDGTASINGTVDEVGDFSLELIVQEKDDNSFNETQSFTISIAKAQLTVKADDQSRVYASANPILTVTYTGFLNGDDEGDLDTAPTASTPAVMGSSVTTYPITVSGGSDNNYDFVYESGILSITKAMLTVKANDQSRAYGAANPILTITYTGFLNGDDEGDLDTAPTASTPAVMGSPVTTYPITASGGSDNNYDFVYESGILSITKAMLTVKANDQSRAYGAANPILTVTYTGFLNGDDEGALDTAPTASTPAVIGSPVTTYPITVSGGSDNNYDFVYESGILSITKAMLTVKANDQSRAYGAANPILTITYTGFLNGDDEGDLDTAPTASTPAVMGSPVTTYPITVSGGSDNNYDFVYESGTLSITKAMLTVQANDQTRAYGAANPILTVTYIGFLNGDDASDLSSLPSASTNAVVGNGVGNYNITVSGGSDENYSLTYVSGILTITKAILIATADNKSRSYGSPNPSFSLAYSGFVNGEDPSVLDTKPTASSSAQITDPVGSYPINVSGGLDDNYDFTYVPGTLTITQAILTATADNQGRSYNSSNPVFTISYSGFVNGESASVINTLPTAFTAATLTTSVGVYPIVVSGGSDNNYSFVYVNGQLTIVKATPVVTWGTPSAITYGTALSVTQLNASANASGAFTYTPASGTVLDAGSQILTADFIPNDLVNYNTVSGINVTLIVNKATPLVTWATPAPIVYGTALSPSQLNATSAVSGVYEYTPSVGAVLNAGTYTLSVNFTPSDVANYNVVNGTTVSITVNKATPVITWNSPAPITYGTALGATQLNASSGSIAGTFAYTPAGGAILNAGTQTLGVTFSPTDAANYTTATGTVSITVNKATPVIIWNTPSPITYGAALSAAQLNATSSTAGTFVYTPAAGTVVGAGTQQLSVNFTPTDGANYTALNGTTVSIIVNKATPVITWANPASITYGTSLSATQLNATSSITGSFTYTPAIGTVLNAGASQTLTAIFTPTDITNYNTVNGITALITVNKANPVITWPTPAPITYGTALTSTQLNASSSVPGSFNYTPAAGAVLNAGANQALSVDFTPTDLANYNSVNGRTVLITVTKATPSINWPTPLPIKINQPISSTQLNATANTSGTFNYTPPVGTSFSSSGTYALSVSFTPSDLNNFNSTTVWVSLVVNDKDNPVITWNNPSPITYGTLLTGTQLNATANVSGSFTYTPPLGTLVSVGANQILSVTFSPTDQVNYNNITSTVQLTVNKAVVTATAVNASRVYGAPNPSLPISYSGFVNGETVAVLDTQPVAAVTAIANTPVGSYPISVTGGSDNNYSFVYVAGSLTINKAVITASVANATRAYGASDPVFNITYSGFVNGESVSVLDTSPTASTAATVTSPTGTYPINASGAIDNNYAFNYLSGLLTITKAPLITTAVSVTRVYGTSNPTFSVTYSGFVNGETATVIDTAPTALSAATTTSAVGTYSIVASGGVDNNYSFIYVSGVLTVTKASPVITWVNPAPITYGMALSNTQLNATASVPGVLIYTPALGSMLAAGTNQILSVKFTPTDQNNYTVIESFNVIITVNKATLTATAKDESRPYGSPNPSFSIFYSGFVNGETETQLDVLPVAATLATANSPAGNYAISVSGGLDNNYSFANVQGSLVVSKITLMAIAVNQSRLFGTPNPPLTIIYNGFVNDDSVEDIETPPVATTTATTSSAAGVYPITISGGDDENYNFNYVPGTLTVSPNFPPSLVDFQVETNEDQPLLLKYENFGNHFSSFSGSPIQSVKIVALPTNGTLLWKGNVIAAGQLVTVQNGQIDNLTYVSNLNYNGIDTFKWNAFEGVFFAQQDATTTIRISAVNDPPLLSNIESASIDYSLGDPAVTITTQVAISDVDNNFIHSAKISITENFVEGDRLSMGFGISSGILATFNPALGELVLTGKDTKSNYEMAIAKATFSSPVSGLAGEKKISISVNDSTSNSNVVFRMVSIDEVFPELGIVNSFTPNGDGVNDSWDFVNLDFYSQINISIFNRDGVMVFSCHEKDCTWDGKINGKELPAGPYYYTIELNGGKRKYQGAVTILK